MVGTRSSPGRSGTPTARTPRRRVVAVPRRVRQPRSRDASDTDSDDHRLAAASGGAPRGRRNQQDDPQQQPVQGNQPAPAQDNQPVAAAAVPAAVPAGPAPNNPPNDDLESMDWWDQLTAGQQRAMMRRFVIQPPVLAPVPAPAIQPVVVNTPAAIQRTKMKLLNLEDFHGTAAESVEAWLATIPQEVERQAGLGGDTWTAEELYYGVTAHLKDAAGKWLITLSETMRNEDKTLSYLVRKLRKKYGRRDNMFKIQQKLASRKQQPGERLSDYAAVLMDIGFGKQVSAETYVEAFISGINNPTAATQVRAYEPQTLEDAVQFAEDKCGEYGEGYRVTDWRQAKRRHRDDRTLGGEDDEQPPSSKRKTSAATALEQLNWKQLGLGVGGDSPPRYDNAGNTINQLEATAKRDPLSIAALQALILTAGAVKDESPSQKSTGRQKAHVLEVKAETPSGNQQHEQQHHNPQWQNRGSGGRFGGGRGYGHGGRGYGRSGLARYGPADNRRQFWNRRQLRGAATVMKWATGGANVQRELQSLAMLMPHNNPSEPTVTGKWPAAVEVGALLFARDKFSEEEETKLGPAGASGRTTRAAKRKVRTNDRWVQLSRARKVSEAACGHSKGKSAGQDHGTSDPNKEKSDSPDGRVDDGVEEELEEKPAATVECTTVGIGTEEEPEVTGATQDSVSMDMMVEMPTVPRGVVSQVGKLSGGRTTASKRRQRRGEEEVAAVRGILKTELKAEHTERAKVLRVVVHQLISELREVEDVHRQGRRRREAQVAAAAVRKCEASTMLRKLRTAGTEANGAPNSSEGQSKRNEQSITEDDWLKEVKRFERAAPKELVEEGSLADIRAARRRAVKAAKRFRWMKRVRRLQQQKKKLDPARVRDGKATGGHTLHRLRRHKQRYQYEQQGCYGDVELRSDGAGREVRVAQLRAVGGVAPSCLPTALVALTKRHTHEVCLDSCAQYSVAGEDMKKYGRCLTRNAPVDVVEGFGGGTSRIIGVWRFVGTTMYQQRIIVDALLVEGQGDELLIGEDWMVDKGVKMDFASRELKYYDEHGQKIILPFTCHGISSLQQPSQSRKIMVR
ncbi:hypothetical protein P3T76_006285 [Phytophthora citrophthora]|uniref:Retrotransposon gag domain-containing protein n=1 Tax=Phytophthora citrophthora TaxID=4793 RepID=A0AAD9LLZ7_9STRA|nr:hypothetical protein P3T76_006285 [Phytophthora citrophthora]